MKLIIAEKPELGRAIANALPGIKENKNNYIQVGDYCITWAVGHILRYKNPEEMDIKFKKWSLDDLPIFFNKWEKIPIEGKEKILKSIGELLKNTSQVIHAGDPDDEGQYLIDEILEYFNYTGSVKRILINDNNTEAIKTSFNKINDNSDYIALGKSAEARAIADMIIGFNLSRFFTLHNNTDKVLTVGRVQTPTLALVVNRDYEIKNHIKEKYYELFLENIIDNEKIKLKYQTNDKNKKLIQSKDEIENIKGKIYKKEGHIIVTKKEENILTPLVFNLAKLQIEANKKYGYTAQKTQDITQILRDKHKAITYNRSDCQYLSEEHFKEAPKLLPLILSKLNLNNIKYDLTEENKSRCFNDKNITAHHGIIPTSFGNLESFSIEEKNIYELIAKRYIIQFMEKEKVKKTEAILKINDHIFKSSSTKTIKLGYKEIYIENNDNLKEENHLSSINSGDYPILIENFLSEEKETKPKQHYTEATLLKDMTNISKYVKNKEISDILKEKDKNKKGENGSIGTPATRATIINELFRRGYLKNEGKKIISTELAKEYLSTLPDILKSADMTANWWLIQEEIKEGKANKEKLTNKVLYDVIKIIESKHNKISSNITQIDHSIGKCPKCKKGKILENSKSFYCSNYKTGCKFSLWKEQRYFDNLLKITNNKAIKLIKGEAVSFKLKTKTNKVYNTYFYLEIGDYINLKKDKKNI